MSESKSELAPTDADLDAGMAWADEQKSEADEGPTESDWTDAEALAFGLRWLNDDMWDWSVGQRLVDDAGHAWFVTSVVITGNVWLVEARNMDGERLVVGEMISCHQLAPDFRDPATRGHALEQLREAWSAPELHIQGHEHEGWWAYAEAGQYLRDANGERVFPQGQCESEAMLAAMEARKASSEDG